MSKNDQKFQVVKITMSDGKYYYFSGMAVLFPGDKRTISNIEFTKPRELPEGTTLKALSEVMEEE